ncbi:hypothetical protein MTR_7g092000 [Medicago truncatula]|uniref:Uncharacterized protein n=1 Tax=Medicago truncatula TaxID=3880 RepID=G7KTJ0_MEDTR|nr:hypothetical protein MTR_7g092000 [Medicago truncatula]
MDSNFRDNINLLNSLSSVLGHCYVFLVKNLVFGLLDRIAPKLLQKIRKNSRTKIQRLLRESAPQNPKFHR